MLPSERKHIPSSPPLLSGSLERLKGVLRVGLMGLETGGPYLLGSHLPRFCWQTGCVSWFCSVSSCVLQ